MAEFLRSGGVTWLSRLDDGSVMCCVCMEYKTRDELADVEGEPGRKWDVCVGCDEFEKGMR